MILLLPARQEWRCARYRPNRNLTSLRPFYSGNTLIGFCSYVFHVWWKILFPLVRPRPIHVIHMKSICLRCDKFKFGDSRKYICLFCNTTWKFNTANTKPASNHDSGSFQFLANCFTGILTLPYPSWYSKWPFYKRYSCKNSAWIFSIILVTCPAQLQSNLVPIHISYIFKST